MASDPLSQVLTVLDARCVLSGGLAARGDWVRRFPQPNALKIMAVAKGSCWLVMAHLPAPLELQAGDVILVNGKHPMRLASDPALPVPETVWGDVQSVADIAPRRHDGDVLIIGGHVAIDPVGQNLLLDVLPALVHVASDTPQAPTLDWLLDQLVRENHASQAGAEAATASLAQLLFVQSLRAVLSTQADEVSGWLRALGDQRLAPALQMIHAEPARNWTVAELARGAGMSRTSFAVHFREVAGTAPLAYVLGWRMRLAEYRLRSASISVSELALEVGYSSESAFSNAFKRVVGRSPRAYRAGAATPRLGLTESAGIQPHG